MEILGQNVYWRDIRAIDKLLQKTLLREEIKQSDFPKSDEKLKIYLKIISHYEVASYTEKSGNFKINQFVSNNGVNETRIFLKNNGFTRIYKEYLYIKFNLLISIIIIFISITSLIISIIALYHM